MTLHILHSQSSTAIDTIQFFSNIEIAAVTFTSNPDKQYYYYVSNHTYRLWRKAPSKGKFFHKNVKPRRAKLHMTKLLDHLDQMKEPMTQF